MKKYTKKEILHQVRWMDNPGAVAGTGKRNKAILEAIDRLSIYYLTDKELVAGVYRFLNENN